MTPFRKVSYSLYLDFLWLLTREIPLWQRLIYIPAKYFSLFRRSLSIGYLGRRFKYDNANTPVTLQTYPSEILRIGELLNLSRGTILDVGANVGQTIVTLKALYPSCQVVGIEANPDVFATLSDNVSGLGGVRILNSAVGPEAKRQFHYVPGFSGKGSFLKENAQLNIPRTDSKSIEIVSEPFSPNFCVQHEIPTKYDLIKIDVEGFELAVIESMSNIRTRAMYVEFSNNREPRYALIKLFDTIRMSFGNFTVFFCDRITPDTTMGNILVTFDDPRGE